MLSTNSLTTTGQLTTACDLQLQLPTGDFACSCACVLLKAAATDQLVSSSPSTITQPTKACTHHKKLYSAIAHACALMHDNLPARSNCNSLPQIDQLMSTCDITMMCKCLQLQQPAEDGILNATRSVPYDFMSIIYICPRVNITLKVWVPN